MGFFDRLSRLVRANANAAVSSMEDPAKILDQSVADMQADLVKLRQAVALGINTQDLIDAMGPDGGTPLVGAVSPISGWAYNNDLPRYPYDPEAAMALLDEAGWQSRIV